MPYDIIHPKAEYYLGADISRHGADETALTIIEKQPFSDENNSIYLVYIETYSNCDLTKTINRILYLNSLFNFRRITIDETGLGSGVVDVLKQNIDGGVLEGVTFTRKSKSEMFYNLKLLMQQGKLKLPNYLFNTNSNVKKLYYQFLSIQQEFNEGSELPKIYHETNAHDDIVCSLALAVWPFRPAKMHRKSYGIAGSYKKY